MLESTVRAEGQPLRALRLGMAVVAVYPNITGMQRQTDMYRTVMRRVCGAQTTVRPPRHA